MQKQGQAMCLKTIISGADKEIKAGVLKQTNAFTNVGMSDREKHILITSQIETDILFKPVSFLEVWRRVFSFSKLFLDPIHRSAAPPIGSKTFKKCQHRCRRNGLIADW